MGGCGGGQRAEREWLRETVMPPAESGRNPPNRQGPWEPWPGTVIHLRFGKRCCLEKSCRGVEGQGGLCLFVLLCFPSKTPVCGTPSHYSTAEQAGAGRQRAVGSLAWWVPWVP